MASQKDAATSRSGIAELTEHYHFAPTPFAITALLICLTLIVTRIISTFYARSNTVTQDGVKSVPKVSYWVPLLGHVPNMAIDATGFMKGLRARYDQGMFAVNFGGTVHNIMYTPGLATALLNQKTSNADSEHVSNKLMKSIFGFPPEEQEKYDAALPEIMACYKHLLSEPGLSDMVKGTAQRISTSIADLVTFSPSLVDQMQWERTSNVKVITNSDGSQTVEASLLPLIRDFCAHQANPTIMGSNFLINFPDFFDDLWTLDRGFLLLAAGVPRWAPIPSATRAHLARRKIMDKLEKFHVAMEKYFNGEDPGSDWGDLSNVGALIQARMVAYRKYQWSTRARAATEHALMWASNANSNALIFWMINHIYADKALLAMIREETEAYVKAVQPKQDFPIAEPPRLATFDIEGLCQNCPLLKSCYIECLRLDTASWSFKVVKQDFVLQPREKDAQAFLLKKGEYAHAAHDLHNTDPNYFEDPMFFKPDRHIKHEEGKVSAEMGSIRPYGGGSSMCKGRSFAFKECMMFVAAIVAVWEMEPAKGGVWKMPKHRKAAGVYGTDDDTRVRIYRRKLPVSG